MKLFVAFMVFSYVVNDITAEIASHFVAGRGCGLTKMIRFETDLDDTLSKDLRGKLKMYLYSSVVPISVCIVLPRSSLKNLNAQFSWEVSWSRSSRTRQERQV